MPDSSKSQIFAKQTKKIFENIWILVDYDLSTGVIQGNINELLQTYFSDVKP